MAHFAPAVAAYRGYQYDLHVQQTAWHYQNDALGFQHLPAFQVYPTAGNINFRGLQARIIGAPQEIWLQGFVFWRNDQVAQNQVSIHAVHVSSVPPMIGVQGFQPAIMAPVPIVQVQPFPQPAQVQPQAGLVHTNPPVANPQAASATGLATFPLFPTIAMPLRSAGPMKKLLPMEFDLPAHQRSATAPRGPPKKGTPKEGKSKASPGTYTPDQTAYLHQLVWFALLMVDRKFKVKDFAAIVEAMDRRFDGTPDYPHRGYNSVHSEVTKDDEYGDFFKRVLP